MTTRTLAFPFALVGLLSLGLTGCPDKGDDTGAEDCTDGEDNDGDDDVDCADSDCADDEYCQEELDCADEVDNDGDGDIDCEDRDCRSDDACLETDAECEDGEDNDNDGDIDCEDDDCECFTPTNYGMGFNMGVQGGEYITPTYNGGAPLENLAVLYLLDYDNYSGLTDEQYTCSIYYSLDSAESLDIADYDDFADLPWAFGWKLSSSDITGTFGNCENLNEDEFGTKDATAFVSDYEWDVVFTNEPSSDMRTTMQTYFSDYDDIKDYLVGAWFGSDYSGSVVFDEYDYGIVYEIDESGELVNDGSSYSFVDMTEATYPVDGWYSGSSFWLPQL